MNSKFHQSSFHHLMQRLLKILLITRVDDEDDESEDVVWQWEYANGITLVSLGVTSVCLLFSFRSECWWWRGWRRRWWWWWSWSSGIVWWQLGLKCKTDTNLPRLTFVQRIPLPGNLSSSELTMKVDRDRSQGIIFSDIIIKYLQQQFFCLHQVEVSWIVPHRVQIVLDCFSFSFSFPQSYHNIRIGFPKKSLFLQLSCLV